MAFLFSTKSPNLSAAKSVDEFLSYFLNKIFTQTGLLFAPILHSILISWIMDINYIRLSQSDDKRSCEITPIGLIKVQYYVGDTYSKGEVFAGEIKPDDIAKKGEVSCLVISRDMCDHEK